MKHFITIISIIILSTISIYGQDRVNRTKLTFQNEGIKITEVTGWGYDSECGEWLECKNTIENNKNYLSYSNSPSSKSHKYYNIISLQFKTIVYNDINYSVLVWEKYDGAYRYPAIMEEWEWWTTKMFLMFTPEDMEKLKNLTNDPILLTIPGFVKGRYDNNIDVDIIQSGMKSMDRNSFTSLYHKYFIIYKATDGSIRFRVDQFKPSIERMYYEMPSDEFQNFITLN